MFICVSVFVWDSRIERRDPYLARTQGTNDGRFRDTDPPLRLPRHACGVLAYKSSGNPQ